MKYTAVIFDLFGTLVDSYSLIRFDNLLAQMAEILGVSRMEFVKNWVQEAKNSMRGRVPDTKTGVRNICTRAGVTPTEAQIMKVVGLRLDFERRILLNPRPDALDVLQILKEKGFKLGLISDCTTEAPQIWQETPMAPFIDTAIFSSKVKMKKPEPGIYRLATSKLGVSPADCLYIGDGSSRELTGAFNAGMYPIQVKIIQGEESCGYSIVQEKWQGDVITSFYELLSYLELPRYSDKLSVLFEY